MTKQDGHESPEEAALSSYSPASNAFLVRVERISQDRVDVIVDTEPSHPMRVRCFRERGAWHYGGDIVE